MRSWMSSITQYYKIASICIVCRQYHYERRAVCTLCHESLRRLPPGCRYCAHPIVQGTIDSCADCIRQQPFFDKIHVSYEYEGVLPFLIQQFKYQKKLHLMSYLADLIMDNIMTLEPPLPDLLIPVPMHITKLRKRGLNHSALLTVEIARRLARPYSLSHCIVVKNTRSQVGLSKQKRRKNRSNSIIAMPTEAKTVAVIDDVVTTGSTANAIAHALKLKGVNRVEIWSCARAQLKKVIC